MNFLEGKKTYILAVAALVIIGANLLGFVDEVTANTLLAVLGFGSVISLRAAIK